MTRLEWATPKTRQSPRVWARIPSPHRLRAWYIREYRAQIGEPPRGFELKLWALVEWLAVNPGADVEDLELRVISRSGTQQPYAEQRGRSPRERIAWRLGVTKDSRNRRLEVFVMPSAAAWAGRDTGRGT